MAEIAPVHFKTTAQMRMRITELNGIMSDQGRRLAELLNPAYNPLAYDYELDLKAISPDAAVAAFIQGCDKIAYDYYKAHLLSSLTRRQAGLSHLELQSAFKERMDQEKTTAARLSDDIMADFYINGALEVEIQKTHENAVNGELQEDPDIIEALEHHNKSVGERFVRAAEGKISPQTCAITTPGLLSGIADVRFGMAGHLLNHAALELDGTEQFIKLLAALHRLTAEKMIHDTNILPNVMREAEAFLSKAHHAARLHTGRAENLFVSARAITGLKSYVPSELPGYHL